MGRVFYNEFNRQAADWLRELMHEQLIPPGVVDERSIGDVSADDLRGFDQVHFCAGIGVWPYALRRAGWEDDRPVGTGSFPCQPFSAAGKRDGFADPRHIWPDGHRLIRDARQQGQRWTDCFFGEQAPTAGAWIDLVRSDLEALGYAFGSPDLPSSLPLAQVLDSFRTYETALRDRANSAQALADRYEKALRAQDDAERRDEQHQELIAQSVGEGWDEVTGGSHLEADWKHVSAAYAEARELRVQALSSQGRHEGVTSGFIPELPGVNAVPLPASPDGPSQMDRVWAAVNVLGAPDTACTSDEDRAYCRAIGDALSEIEKLGGRPQ